MVPYAMGLGVASVKKGVVMLWVWGLLRSKKGWSKSGIKKRSQQKGGPDYVKNSGTKRRGSSKYSGSEKRGSKQLQKKKGESKVGEKEGGQKVVGQNEVGQKIGGQDGGSQNRVQKEGSSKSSVSEKRQGVHLNTA